MKHEWSSAMRVGMVLLALVVSTTLIAGCAGAITPCRFPSL